MRSFRCACGRVQGYAEEGTPGGVTIAEAKAIGWTFDGREWLCPFCSRSGTPRAAAAIAEGPKRTGDIIAAAGNVKS